MGKHAIIIIKNDKNEYLQYYDNNWDSYLFLNCKLLESFDKEDVLKDVICKLNLSNNLNCEYLGDKIHSKYSESAKKEKEYHHYFYIVDIKDMPISMNDKNFEINNVKYSWYSLMELESDQRIQKVNSDIVEFVKELESK